MNNNLNNDPIYNLLTELRETINDLFSKPFYVYPSKNDFEELKSISKKKKKELLMTIL